MYTSSSLSPLSLSLPDVLVSDLSPSLLAKQSSSYSIPYTTCILQQVLKIFVGAMIVMVGLVVVVVVVVVFLCYLRDSTSLVAFVLQLF